jgi:hypothetical protein
MEAAPRDSREFAYELKFHIGNPQAEALKGWVRERLQPDPHGGGPHGDSYRVSSIYFDTQTFDVLARRGSYARSKYRVRRYNHGEVVYLERKTRGQYRVFKRRSAAALAALARLQEPQAAPDWDGRWFHRRLLVRRLQAVSRVDYQRVARIGHSDYGPVRLTLDQELLAWRTGGLSFEVADRGTPLSTQQLILELKFGHAMPAVFKQLIREFSPYLTGISKYRLACFALGLAPQELAAQPLAAADTRALQVAADTARPSEGAVTNGTHGGYAPAAANGVHGTQGDALAHGSSHAATHGSGLVGATAAPALRRQAL